MGGWSSRRWRVNGRQWTSVDVSPSPKCITINKILAERVGFEFTRKGNVGSNPTLSASILLIIIH